jgi:hypothetical protein
MTRIYIITTIDGAPLAFAQAVSQAEATRLYVEHIGLSARPASALEAVQRRDLPVLTRQQDAPDDTQT